MPKTKDKDTKKQDKPKKTIEKNKKTKKVDITDLESETDFSSPQLKEGEIKIVSWNVVGFKSIMNKGFEKYLKNEDPHMIFLNETKINSNMVDEDKFPGYHSYFYSGEKKGYSGVALITKIVPKSIKYGIGIEEHDNEGRVITATFDDFIIVGSYIPNSGSKLVRLDYRDKWDQDFTNYLVSLKGDKPIIWCGDLNVAHKEIDLKNPKANKNKTAGFSDTERNNFQKVLNKGFVDSFRHFKPEETGCYTFWSTRRGGQKNRQNNTGWRLDYFVVTQDLIDSDRLSESYIRRYVMGSDHAPIVLHIKSSISGVAPSNKKDNSNENNQEENKGSIFNLN